MLSAKIRVTVKGNPHLDKQQTFALASSLTLVAKEAQTATRKALNKAEGGAFTIRNNWLGQSNPLGIKVRPATKQNLEAWVGTGADFLEKFVEKQTGVIVDLPQGRYFAIPTTNVRRTKRDIVQKSQRPKSLIGKRDFIIKSQKKGVLVLFQRKGRGKGSVMVALYVLYPQRKIQERDVLFGPAKTVFERRFASILEQQLHKAFATAK